MIVSLKRPDPYLWFCYFVSLTPYTSAASTTAPWCSLYRLQVAWLYIFQCFVEFSRPVQSVDAYFLSGHHSRCLKPAHRLASIELLDINLIVLPFLLFIDLLLYWIIDLLDRHAIVVDDIQTATLEILDVEDWLLYYSFLLSDHSVYSFCLQEDMVLLLDPF